MIRKLVIGIMILVILGSIPLVYLLSTTKPLRISSLDTSFALGAEIRGRYKVTERAVEIYVLSARLRYQLPLRRRKIIDDVSFFLTGESELSFKSHERSGKLSLEYPVNPGDQLFIFCQRFSIPISESTDLGERWLTFHIRSRTLDSPARSPKVVGHSYAHSDKGIFQHP